MSWNAADGRLSESTERKTASTLQLEQTSVGFPTCSEPQEREKRLEPATLDHCWLSFHPSREKIEPMRSPRQAQLGNTCEKQRQKKRKHSENDGSSCCRDLQVMLDNSAP